ncbi:MAG: PstS family phosphate ABC transporter substrate-binding protein [Planctomycetaceae bacterium]
MKTLGATLNLFALTAVLAVANTAFAQAPGIDSLPQYRPANDVSGKITMIGSNTMSQLAAGWSDSFRRLHPDVEIDIDIRGARDAVDTVISGDATFGLLSRAIREDEVLSFQQKFGYQPKVLTPALERMAIFVHPSNPVKELSLQQIADLFGENGKAKTWGDVGATGEWASRPIALQGRGPTTGSTVYLQTVLLRGDDFKNSMVQQPNNILLVKAVEANPNAIGYAGLLSQTASVRAVALSVRSGLPAIAIDSIEADQGRYPLMRPLQLVINQPPGQELPLVQSEFLKYVFSRLGQEGVVKGGFQPIPGQNASFALGQLGLRERN